MRVLSGWNYGGRFESGLSAGGSIMSLTFVLTSDGSFVLRSFSGGGRGGGGGSALPWILLLSVVRRWSVLLMSGSSVVRRASFTVLCVASSAMSPLRGYGRNVLKPSRVASLLFGVNVVCLGFLWYLCVVAI